jgi:hypothetical protein
MPRDDLWAIAFFDERAVLKTAQKSLAFFCPPHPISVFGFPAGAGSFTKLEYLILNH